MDIVIGDISKQFKQKWFKKIYADDLAVITKKIHAYEFIRVCKQVFEKYELIFN